MKDREDKISGKIKVSNGPKKQRGKDRIIKKFHEMQQKEKLDNVKSTLYDKVVIRPSEAFNRYV